MTRAALALLCFLPFATMPAASVAQDCHDAPDPFLYCSTTFDPFFNDITVSLFDGTVLADMVSTAPFITVAIAELPFDTSNWTEDAVLDRFVQYIGRGEIEDPIYDLQSEVGAFGEFETVQLRFRSAATPTSQYQVYYFVDAVILEGRLITITTFSDSADINLAGLEEPHAATMANLRITN